MLKTHRATDGGDGNSNNINDYFTSNLNIDSASGYVDYLFRSLKTSDYYIVWNRMITYFRRFRLLRTIYKIVLFMLALLRTSALIILIALVLTVAIPLSLLAFLAFPLISWIKSFKYNKKILSLISGKDVFVFFPPRSSSVFNSSYLFNNALDMAKRKGGFALIISPYFLSPAAPEGYAKSFYTNCLANGSKVAIIRRYYYFNLKRKILSKHANSINLIY